jgi:tetratricopeptide (TPR) repeat protein
MKRTAQFLTSLLIVLVTFSAASAQESPRDRGIALYKQGNIDLAVPLLEEAVGRAGRQDAELWNYLGLAYLKKQQIKKGRLALENAVKLDSGNLSYRSFLAYAYLLDKQEKKARAEADNVLALDPKNVWAYYVRGRANLSSFNFDEAIADAGRMLALDSNSAQAYTVKSDTIFGKFIERVKRNSSLKSGQELLQEAGDILRECLRSCQNNIDAQSQQQKLDIIEAFKECCATTGWR